MGTERNQGHTLISAQSWEAAPPHKVHEETLGGLGGITVGKEGLPAPQPRVFTPGPSRGGQRLSCPAESGVAPGDPGPDGGGRCPPLLPRLPPRPAPPPQRLPPPRGQAGWHPSALTCFLLSRGDDGGRVLGSSSAPRDAAGRDLPLSLSPATGASAEGRGEAETLTGSEVAPHGESRSGPPDFTGGSLCRADPTYRGPSSAVA